MGLIAVIPTSSRWLGGMKSTTVQKHVNYAWHRESTAICFSTTLRPALPQVFLGHIQEKSQIHPWVFSFPPLQILSVNKILGILPKHTPNLSGAVAPWLDGATASATINSSTPVSPRADSLLQPVRASQSTFQRQQWSALLPENAPTSSMAWFQPSLHP